MKMERLIEIRAELVKDGEVNGYKATTEYAKKMAAITAQMNRLVPVQVKPAIKSK